MTLQNRFIISAAKAGTFVLFAISATIHVVPLKPKNHSNSKAKILFCTLKCILPQSQINC